MVRVSTCRNVATMSIDIEIGTRESAIRISHYEHDLQCDMRHWVGVSGSRTEVIPKEYLMLYEYLKDSGRVIYLTADIAMQTIRYLKETN
jgi:hypothetical protein